MSESREFNASTVEEAVAKAVNETGISEESLSYEVLDKGSDGFLGIGVRDARVSVSLPNGSVEAAEVNEAAEVSDEQETDAETSEDSSDDSQESSGGDLSEVLNSEEKPREDEVSEELVEEIRSLTSGILEAADINTKVDVYDAGEYVAVDLVSDHTALLIGQKGETIDALQHIVNAAAYRGREFEKRIVLDSEGYRQRRIEAIQGMANRMARKARREHQDVQLPPMNSSERRIVHVFLQEDDRVETFSDGTGDQRRVTISPK